MRHMLIYIITGDVNFDHLDSVKFFDNGADYFIYIKLIIILYFETVNIPCLLKNLLTHFSIHW